MATLANRRSVMTLFTTPNCPESHRVRIVLAEKDLTYDHVECTPDNMPEDLIDLNPYGSLPTLVDRDLVLYNSRVIMEYLDERFPHPPLLPVDPVSRARNRLALHRIENDWYGLINEIQTRGEKAVSKARKSFRESLLSSSELFDIKPYFLSDEFSLLDATIAPLLWRLPYYGIDLPDSAKPIQDYANRIFKRSTFQESLTESEKDMRS